MERIAADLAAADRCVVLGRGFEYATAREWALKLKELARVFADPYSAADFQHGPVALVEPGVPVLAVAPAGIGGGRHGRAARPARGSAARTSSSCRTRRRSGRSATARSRCRQDVPEWLRPIVSIVPAQLYAYHVTLARGLDPEAPRNVSKVTRTR